MLVNIKILFLFEYNFKNFDNCKLVPKIVRRTIFKSFNHRTKT